MKYHFHTEKQYKGFTIGIKHCDYGESPDDWSDDEAFLGEISHRNYRIGNKRYPKHRAECHIPFGEGQWDFHQDDMDLAYSVETEDELKEEWERVYDPSCMVYAVELCDYGSNGARLRECDHHKADGYIFVEVPYSNDLERLVHADFDPEAVKDRILAIWNQYLEGDVHSFSIMDSDGEVIQSCGGIYGSNEALESAEAEADAMSTMTKKVKVLIVRGSEPLPFPGRAEVESAIVEVPLWVGSSKVIDWMISEGPFRNSIDIVTVCEYTDTRQIAAR